VLTQIYLDTTYWWRHRTTATRPSALSLASTTFSMHVIDWSDHKERSSCRPTLGHISVLRDNQ
jgi:hypothetical protein